MDLHLIQESPPIGAWHAFLDEHADASVYHTPEFRDCLLQAGIDFCVLHCQDVNGKVAGLALVILDRLAPIPLLGSKAFAPAGMLASSERALQLLLAGANRMLRTRTIFFEQYYEGQGPAEICAEAGFRIDQHRNFLLDLGGKEGGFRKAYSRSIQRNLRKGNAQGLKLGQASNLEELRRVHQLLSATCERVDAPCLPWKLLKGVYHNLVPRGMARIYLATVGDGGLTTAINARIELLYKERAIDWYTGADERWVHSQAGTWLVDQILMDLQKAGIRIFDFGGGGRVGEVYGPAEFKRRFGGREVEVTRYQKVYHKFLHGLAKGIWKRLHPDQGRRPGH